MSQADLSQEAQYAQVSPQVMRILDSQGREKGWFGVLRAMGISLLVVSVLLMTVEFIWSKQLWFMDGVLDVTITRVFLSSFFLHPIFFWHLHTMKAEREQLFLGPGEQGVGDLILRKKEVAQAVLWSVLCLLMIATSVWAIISTYHEVLTETVVMSNAFIRENEGLLQGLVVSYYSTLLLGYVSLLVFVVMTLWRRRRRIQWINDYRAAQDNASLAAE